MQDTISALAEQLLREHKEEAQTRGRHGWSIQNFTFFTTITG